MSRPPTLFTVSKSYNGPEDETATGPNFPRQYTVTVDIAAGQTLSSLSITDVLPDNLAYLSLMSASPVGYDITPPEGDEPLSGAAQVAPDNDLVVYWSSITGGSGNSDARATFQFFVPRDDASGARVIDPASGDDVLFSCNQAQAGGVWVPVDSRDFGASPVVSPVGCEHELTDKSIAIQKGVQNVTDASNSPGDLLEYTLTFHPIFAQNRLQVIEKDRQ